MADAMSAGARDDAFPASDIYDLSAVSDAEAAQDAVSASPYRQISILELTMVWAIAAILWTAVFAALLS